MDQDITIDVTVTLEDQVKFNEYMLDQPVMRRRRLVRWALVVLLSPLLGVVLGFLIEWITSTGSPASFRDAVAVVNAGDMLPPYIAVSGFLLAAALLLRLFRPYLLRRAVRRLLKEREGIDPNDPQLSEHVRCSFNEEGFTSEGVASRSTIRWAQVRSLDEAHDLLIVRTGTLSGFLLPKRDVTAAQVAAIMAIAESHKGRRDGLSAPLAPGRLAN